MPRSHVAIRLEYRGRESKAPPLGAELARCGAVVADVDEEGMAHWAELFHYPRVPAPQRSTVTLQLQLKKL